MIPFNSTVGIDSDVALDILNRDKYEDLYKEFDVEMVDVSSIADGNQQKSNILYT